MVDFHNLGAKVGQFIEMDSMQEPFVMEEKSINITKQQPHQDIPLIASAKVLGTKTMS